MVRSANLGHSDVLLAPQQLSARALHKATQYSMDPNTFIADWQRGAAADPDGLLPEFATQAQLRQLVFACSMQLDDKARLLKGCQKPSIWSNPTLLSVADKLTLGSKVSQDHSLREQQASKCKQLAPVLGALSSLGALGDIVTRLIPDPDGASEAGLALDGAVAQMSDIFHLLAFDITALQRRRKALLLSSYAGVDGLDIDDKIDEADWSLADGARCNDDTDIVELAATYRKCARELQQLKGAKRQRHTGDFRQGKSGQAGRGKSRTARRRRGKRDQASSSGDSSGGDKTKNEDSSPQGQGRGGGSSRGGGRGRGRGNGRGHGRGMGRGTTKVE